MPIRPATSADLPKIAEILTTAFWDEDAVGRLMHPKRSEFPEDMREYWQRRIRANWWNYDHSIAVATSDDGEVVGVADWAYTRSLDTGWSFRHISWRSAKLYNSISSYFWPDRAADPSTINAYEEAVPFFAHHWTGTRSQALNLECLGVNPSHQGGGYGRRLVAWGLEKAAREGIAASVVSAHGKERFYRSCGFSKEVGSVTTGEGNPLAGVRGGTIFFRDAPGTVVG